MTEPRFIRIHLAGDFDGERDQIARVIGPTVVTVMNAAETVRLLNEQAETIAFLGRGNDVLSKRWEASVLRRWKGRHKTNACDE